MTRLPKGPFLALSNCLSRQSCSRGACIDAIWKDWSSWEACSKSCDGGITWRHRTLAQKANECGMPAVGMAMEHAGCNRGIKCHKDVDCAPRRMLSGSKWLIGLCIRCIHI